MHRCRGVRQRFARVGVRMSVRLVVRTCSSMEDALARKSDTGWMSASRSSHEGSMYAMMYASTYGMLNAINPEIVGLDGRATVSQCG
jgi:hypothetical protein